MRSCAGCLLAGGGWRRWERVSLDCVAGLKVHWFEPKKWYNIRHRYGRKETRKQRGEVFGCVPYGRGASSALVPAMEGDHIETLLSKICHRKENLDVALSHVI